MKSSYLFQLDRMLIMKLMITKESWVILNLIYEYFIILWGFFLIGFLGIGGFFMFRKFLKQLPKQDGRSEMDWQRHYISKTNHMWQQEELDLLEEFVQPVPELFRDVARESISSKIGEIALLKESNIITRDILIEGYIVGTPKRDHKFLRKTLKEKNIDVTPFEEYFHLSKKEYNQGWEQKYKEQQKSQKKTSTN